MHYSCGTAQALARQAVMVVCRVVPEPSQEPQVLAVLHVQGPPKRRLACSYSTSIAHVFVQVCSSFTCPVDCRTDDWEPWAECSASCNGGSSLRSRKIIAHQAGTGAFCSALQEQKACGSTSCPKDCKLDHWSSWSTCDTSCGLGQVCLNSIEE